MRQWIREWLGINDLHRYLQYIQNDCNEIRDDLRRYNNGIGAAISGVGRVVAKIDPLFGVSEFDPKRIEESKKLEEEIIAKLKAEHNQRNKYNV